MNDLSGKTIEQFKIIEQIGVGQLGTTYRATNEITGADVALKFLHGHFSRLAAFEDAFWAIEQLTTQLGHPSLINVQTFGKSIPQKGDALLFVVMDYLDGWPLDWALAQLRQEKKWPLLSESIELVRQICSAVDNLVRRQAPSRDYQPDNILLVQDANAGLPYRPVLTDLGLGTLLVDTQGLQPPPPSIYTAPEQTNDQPVDARSHVYTLGMILHELIFGHLPSPELHAQAERLLPLLPKPLIEVINQSLEENPEKRYQTPGDMAAALATIRDSTEPLTTVPLDMQQAVSLGPLLSTKPTVNANPDEAQSLTGSITPDSQRPKVPNHRPSPEALWVRIIDAQRQQRIIPLSRELVVIGRESDSQLQLVEDKKVSRDHAQIEQKNGRIYITDLGSRNGTILDGEPLVPHQAAEWNQGQELVIGLHKLQLTSPPAAKSEPNDGQIFITLTHDEPLITPGQPFEIQVKIENLSTQVAHFSTSIRSASNQMIPAEWITIRPERVQLNPGETDDKAILTITPPVTPTSRAGDYECLVEVVCYEFPQIRAEKEFSFKMAPYFGFHHELYPQKSRVNRTAEVVITNQGNMTEAFQLAFQDAEGELLFEPPTSTFTIKAGESQAVPFKAATKKRIWYGESKTHSMTVNVSSPNNESQKTTTDLDHSPIIARWAPKAVLGAAVVLVGAFLGIRRLYMPDGLLDVIPNPVVHQEPFRVEWDIENATSVDLFYNDRPYASGLEPRTAYTVTELLTARQDAYEIAIQMKNPLGAFPKSKSFQVVMPTLVPTPTATPLPLPAIQAFTAQKISFPRGSTEKVRFEVELLNRENAARVYLFTDGGKSIDIEKNVLDIDLPEKTTSYTIYVDAKTEEEIIGETITIEIKEPTLTVGSSGVNLRQGPGTNYDLARFLPSGTALLALSRPIQPGTPEEWIEVEVDGTGEEGFVAFGGNYSQAGAGVELEDLPEPDVPPTPEPTAAPEPTPTTPPPTAVPTPALFIDIDTNQLVVSDDCVQLIWKVENETRIDLTHQDGDRDTVGVAYDIPGTRNGGNMAVSNCDPTMLNTKLVKGTNIFVWEVFVGTAINRHEKIVTRSE